MTEPQTQTRTINTVPYGGAELIEDLRILQALASNGEVFDAKVCSVVEAWKNTEEMPCQTATDDQAFQTFLRSGIPGAKADHHVKTHTELHGNQELFDQFTQICKTLDKTGSLESVDALPFVDATKTRVEIVKGYGEPVPNNVKITFQATTTGLQQQKACDVSPLETQMVLRNGVPALVTEQSSPYFTHEWSATVWCSHSIHCKDGFWRPKFKMCRPGTMCFTGTPVASKFNPCPALIGYVRDLLEPGLTLRRSRIQTSLGTYLEDMDTTGTVWCLSIV
jgi:hypothetical protein